GRHAGVRPRRGDSGRCRRRALAAHERRPESRPGLYRRLVHGRRVRLRRKPVGHARERSRPRGRQQAARARGRRRAREDPRARVLDPVHSEASERAVPAEGTRRGGLMLFRRLLTDDRGGRLFLAALGVVTVIVPIANIVMPPDSPLHMSTFTVALLGKFLCYALLAIALDLVWGYAGILSLGHGAFFALGGYAMGMYLMRQVGTRDRKSTRLDSSHEEQTY